MKTCEKQILTSFKLFLVRALCVVRDGGDDDDFLAENF